MRASSKGLGPFIAYVPLGTGVRYCLVGAVIVTVAVGAVLLDPLLLVSAFAVLVAAVVIRTSFGRLAVYVGGILVIFQSSVLGTGVRLAFVAVVLVGVIPALLSIERHSNARGLHLRRLIAPSIVLGSLLLLGLPLSRSTPVTLDDWVRDATTYLLIALGPIYGIDGALNATRRQFEALVIVIGCVGAAAYMVAWLSRRGYGIGGLSQFALANGTVVIPSIILCLIFFYKKARFSYLWAVLAVTQAAMLLASGGRSTAIILAAIFSIMFVFGPGLGGGAIRNAGLVLVGLAGFAAAIVVTDSAVRVGYLVQRLSFFQDASLAALQEDGSGLLRLRAYDTAWSTFIANPLFGTGFGYNYPSVQSDVVVRGLFSLDSPMIISAKLGIVGTAILVIALLVLFIRVVQLHRKGTAERREIALLIATTVVALIAVLPSGPVTEQKGLGICLAFVIGLGVVWLRDGLSDENPQQGIEKQQGSPASVSRSPIMSGRGTDT